MSLRFRKRFGLGPFKLNLSLSGVSVSVGVPGAAVTIPIIGRRRKPAVSVGLPGTGLYYQQSIDPDVPKHVAKRIAADKTDG
jgi:hypothetical protein